MNLSHHLQLQGLGMRMPLEASSSLPLALGRRGNEDREGEVDLSEKTTFHADGSIL